MHPVDVLLVTALSEEDYAWRFWLDPSGPDLPLGVTCSRVGSLWVGRFCIEEKGGIGSAVKLSPVLEAYRPRLVLLVGIAAGPSGSIGQIGIAGRVIYISHGKIREGKLKPEIRSSQEEVVTDSFVRGRARALGQGGRVGVWSQRAIQWFEEAKEGWGDQFVGEQFPSQEWPASAGRAFAADLASGEMVIADSKYQYTVQRQFPKFDLKIFEMESYAVGRACQRLGIPFVTIRGVSDDGTKGKDDKRKKDRHRLAATLVGSAFARELLRDHQLIAHIEGIHRSSSQLHPLCYHPGVFLPCPHGGKCIDDGLAPRESKLSPLVRVYESVYPTPYSEAFRDSLSSKWSEARVSLFFPYSPRELLGVVKRSLMRADTPGGENVVKRLEVVWQRRQVLQEAREGEAEVAEIDREMKDLMEEVARASRELYPHFQACEEVAKKLTGGEGVESLARIDRVLVLEEEPDFQDPILHLYHLLLGNHVPTWWVKREALDSRQLAVDDIIFVEREPVPTSGGSEDRWLLALRFFEASSVLAVTGWLCEASGLSGSDRTDALSRISSLYDSWNRDRYAAESGSPTDLFHEWEVGGRSEALAAD